jgi:hypothetical protein
MTSASQGLFLVFSNPGEIDPRAITVLGVNAKESTNPIGFFGTGLKYAIAVALREHCQITIQSGLRTFSFSTKPETIRGKPFDLIHMEEAGVSQPLGFTLDLGKNWLPWMAYRELWCNAKDEGGSVTVMTSPPKPVQGQTQIIVQGDAMRQAHAERHTWILSGEALVKHAACNIHEGNTEAVFYRGIAVTKLSHPSLFTYNLQAKQKLTEDRTLDQYSTKYGITQALMEAAPPEVLRQVLLASDRTFESGLDFDWSSLTPSPHFVALTEELFHTRLAKLNKTALPRCRRHFKAPMHKSAALTKIEEKMLAKALGFLKSMGYEVSQEICIVETLGSQWNLGLAKDGKIFLPKHIFGKGTKYVTSTLLEEHLHITLELADCSRDLQDWLFDKVISLAEELHGEPL